MKPFALLTAVGQTRRLRQLADLLLAQYPLRVISYKLINHGENTTFDVRAEPLDGHDEVARRFILRIHRPGYSRSAVRSELAWVQALRRDAGIFAPDPVPTLDGDLISSAKVEGIVGGRKAVLFRWLKGSMRSTSTLTPPLMRQVGVLTARLHQHSLGWQLPEDFARPEWDLSGFIGEEARFGPPLRVPGLDAEDRRVLQDAARLMQEDFEDIGQDEQEYLLIHADLYRTNVLFQGGAAHPIDFDDCGLGYRLYDIAVTFRILWDRRSFDVLHDAYQQGYWSVLPDYQWEPGDLEPFLMARAFMELAWFGSRADHPDMRDGLPEIIEQTIERANEYLDED